MNVPFGIFVGLCGHWWDSTEQGLDCPICTLIAKHESEADRALSLIREHGFGLNSRDLEDAVRQVLQVAILQAGNAELLEERIRELEMEVDEVIPTFWEGVARGCEANGSPTAVAGSVWKVELEAFSNPAAARDMAKAYREMSENPHVPGASGEFSAARRANVRAQAWREKCAELEERVAELEPQVQGQEYFLQINDVPGLSSRIAEREADNKLLRGAMAAQDNREFAAADRIGMTHSCDWPDDVAERVLTLEARNTELAADNARLLQANRDSVDTCEQALAHAKEAEAERDTLKNTLRSDEEQQATLRKRIDELTSRLIDGQLVTAQYLERAEKAEAERDRLLELMRSVPLQPVCQCTFDEISAADCVRGFSDIVANRLIRSCRSAAYEIGIDRGRAFRAALAPQPAAPVEPTDTQMLDWLEKTGFSTVEPISVYPRVERHMGVHSWREVDHLRWTARWISSEFTNVRDAVRAAMRGGK